MKPPPADCDGFVKVAFVCNRRLLQTNATSGLRPAESGADVGHDLGGVVDEVPPGELEVPPANRLASVSLHRVAAERLRRVMAACVVALHGHQVNGPGPVEVVEGAGHRHPGLE